MQNFDIGIIFIYSIVFLFILIFINYIYKKNKFCLDYKDNFKQNHKLLLNKKKLLIPLSGSLYFFLCFFIAIFIFNIQLKILLFTFFFLLLGFLADINFIVSPKKRIIFQIIFCIIFFYFNTSLNLETRVPIIDYLLTNNFFKVVFISFLLLTLINGYNFIDGTNLLAGLNFFIVIFFLFLISLNFLEMRFNQFFIYFLVSLIIFIFLNFLGKNFLGDGGSYGIGAFIGLFIINELPQIREISPYFVINLLFYPAFENLFTILRRNFFGKKKFIADNEHLHHYIFKYLSKYLVIKKISVISSLVGFFINLYLFVSVFIAYNLISYTKYQIYIILFNTVAYVGVYFFLKKNY